MTSKTYDKAYFDRWYHRRDTRVNTHPEVRRKVTLAVATAEYFLRRPVRTVLDVGCGEGGWLPHLRALRRNIEYTGYDSSDYAVSRFGRERNIRKATFGDLPKLKLGVYDLVICSDVMHYVPDAELRAGIKTLAAATDGVAYLEVLTREDDIIGDLDAFLRRPANWYRKLFTSAGFTFVAPYCWASPAFEGAVAALESGQ
ncbi:MAG TPA: class I SAM-dependent methyltransferase [Thermoanaerobaculia bacterium]|nr:class I SAM-dependent methyltransferase [Thermoanaerobaculia bacterium]